MSEELELGDLTHIERPSLPWRIEKMTECGLDADRHPTWTREESQSIAKKLGRQRFAMHCCMTCMSTAQHHARWEDDPASCMVRHASSMTLSAYGRIRPNLAEEKRRFADELRAIALLIEAHRDEFDALVESLGDVVDISQKRRATR